MQEIVVGYHAIEEALKRAEKGSSLYLCRNGEKRNNVLASIASKSNIPVKKISIAELDKMTGGADHRGVVLLLKKESHSASMKVSQIDLKSWLQEKKEASQLLVLILDGITDPQNLGAILRSADQFAVDLVILPERNSAQVNATVMKVSSGAAQYVPVAVVKNLVRSMNMLQEQGFWVYGADMGGDSVCSGTVDLSGRTALVMGSEGDGMNRLVKETCDRIVSIPMHGHIDSLNVSVAAGILMYEARRNAEN